MKLDLHIYDDEWERGDPLLKEELMMISYNIDPYSGKRMLTRNASNFTSRNSLYRYTRVINDDKTWIVEMHLSSTDPYNKPLQRFEVVMPEEFLDSNLFMKINIGEISI